MISELSLEFMWEACVDFLVPVFFFSFRLSFLCPRLSCLENTELDPSYKNQFLKFQHKLLWRNEKKNWLESGIRMYIF